jgi:glucose/arabinose dehydrogenase
MFPRVVLLFTVCLAIAACDKSSPDNGNGAVQITGNERIGWDQPADNTAELSSFHYRIWVDGAASDLTGVSCADTAGASGFSCTAALPSMSQGTHTLELSAYVEGTPSLESERSAALRVNVTNRTLAVAGRTMAPLLTTADGIQLQPELIAEGLNDVTDLSFASDGRVFISERGGRILVVAAGGLSADPAVILDDVLTGSGNGLLAVAVDPKFAETSFVYAAYTTATGLQLIRFVESHGRLVNRAVLMTDLPHRAENPAISLRFGPDLKLYLGLDDGGDPRRAGDLGSYSGKVLRLNADATTPADQAGGTPVYLLNLSAPHGLSWGDQATMWVAETTETSTGVLQAALSAGPQRRAQTATRYALPEGMTPAALISYQGSLIEAFRGNLLVALADRPEILRLRTDASNPTMVLQTERLPADAIGQVRALGVSPDGSIYLCSANAVALFRLPATAPGTAAPPVIRFPG